MGDILRSDNGTLVVGDVHVKQGQNLRRADWLGSLIKDLKPKRVVFIGDFLTLDCFSAWDKDKRKLMENRRYAKEAEKGREFIERLGVRVGKYSPEYILTEGNHEDRLWRYVDEHPELDGHLDYRRDLGIEGWQYVPYKEYYTVAGANFTHIPISEAGRPIGGKYVCHKALEIHHGSTIFGHTHKLQFASTHPHGCPNLKQALNVGCFFEHVDDYAKGSVTSYWRGVVYLDHYKNGRFGWHPISMGKLRKEYG